MAEIGIIASVIQIADTGLRLSIKLYTFGEIVSTADKSVISISKDVSLTSSVLKELGGLLENDRQSHIFSKNAVQTADTVVKECLEVFQEMENILVKKLPRLSGQDDVRGVGGGKKSKATALLERMKWGYLQPKLQLLRSNLDRLKSTLLLMLNVITYARQVAGKSEPPSVIEDQRSLIEDLARSNQDYIRKFEELKLGIEDTPRTQAQNIHSDRTGNGMDWQWKQDTQKYRGTENARPGQNSPENVNINDICINANVQDSSINQRLDDNAQPQQAREAGPGKDDLFSHLRHYLSLVNNLLNEVDEIKYEIRIDSRDRVRSDICQAYQREMKHLDSSRETMKSALAHRQLVPLVAGVKRRLEQMDCASPWSQGKTGVPGGIGSGPKKAPHSQPVTAAMRPVFVEADVNVKESYSMPFNSDLSNPDVLDNFDFEQFSQESCAFDPQEFEATFGDYQSTISPAMKARKESEHHKSPTQSSSLEQAQIELSPKTRRKRQNDNAEGRLDHLEAMQRRQQNFVEVGRQDPEAAQRLQPGHLPPIQQLLQHQQRQSVFDQVAPYEMHKADIRAEQGTHNLSSSAAPLNNYSDQHSAVHRQSIDHTMSSLQQPLSEKSQHTASAGLNKFEQRVTQPHIAARQSAAIQQQQIQAYLHGQWNVQSQQAMAQAPPTLNQQTRGSPITSQAQSGPQSQVLFQSHSYTRPDNQAVAMAPSAQLQRQAHVQPAQQAQIQQQRQQQQQHQAAQQRQRLQYRQQAYPQQQSPQQQAAQAYQQQAHDNDWVLPSARINEPASSWSESEIAKSAPLGEQQLKPNLPDSQEAGPSKNAGNMQQPKPLDYQCFPSPEHYMNRRPSSAQGNNLYASVQPVSHDPDTAGPNAQAAGQAHLNGLSDGSFPTAHRPQSLFSYQQTSSGMGGEAHCFASSSPREQTTNSLPLESPERELRAKPEGPFAGLEGCVVVKDGMVEDKDANTVGVIVDGDTKRLIGRTVDEDGDIIDKHGNVNGHAEPYNEPEEEFADLSSLDSKVVNKASNIVDEYGTIYSRIAEGDPAELAGRKVDGEGHIWSNNGKIIGQAELLPGGGTQAGKRGLEELEKASEMTSPSYSSDNDSTPPKRYMHAMRRPRGPGGRFLTADEVKEPSPKLSPTEGISVPVNIPAEQKDYSIATMPPSSTVQTRSSVSHSSIRVLSNEDDAPPTKRHKKEPQSSTMISPSPTSVAPPMSAALQQEHPSRNSATSQDTFLKPRTPLASPVQPTTEMYGSHLDWMGDSEIDGDYPGRFVHDGRYSLSPSASFEPVSGEGRINEHCDRGLPKTGFSADDEKNTTEVNTFSEDADGKELNSHDQHHDAQMSRPGFGHPIFQKSFRSSSRVSSVDSSAPRGKGEEIPPRRPARSSTSSMPNRDYVLELAGPIRSSSLVGARQVYQHPDALHCSLCPKTFTEALDLRSHLRIHFDERLFFCSVCDATFVRPHDKKMHEGQHTEDHARAGDEAESHAAKAATHEDLDLSPIRATDSDFRGEDRSRASRNDKAATIQYPAPQVDVLSEADSVVDEAHLEKKEANELILPSDRLQTSGREESWGSAQADEMNMQLDLDMGVESDSKVKDKAGSVVDELVALWTLLPTG